MQKWMMIVLVAAMGTAMGCETPKPQQAGAEQAEATPTEQTEQAEQAADQQAKEQADESAGEEAKEQAAAQKSGLPDDLEAGQTGHYGGEFSVEGDPITLASAIDKAAAADAPVKVKASVEKVCKKKGCWFTLTGQGVDNPVRVRMKDYSFFVPRNADGAEAVVEGTLEERTIPQAEAQHYADDEAAGTGKEPAKVDGDQKGWEMTITAAQITKS